MDPISSLLLVLGIFLLLDSWVMLIFAASDESFAWGFMSVILPPVGYLYALFDWQRGRDSILLAAVGGALVCLQFMI